MLMGILIKGALLLAAKTVFDRRKMRTAQDMYIRKKKKLFGADVYEILTDEDAVCTVSEDCVYDPEGSELFSFCAEKASGSAVRVKIMRDRKNYTLLIYPRYTGSVSRRLAGMLEDDKADNSTAYTYSSSNGNTCVYEHGAQVMKIYEKDGYTHMLVSSSIPLNLSVPVLVWFFQEETV